MVKNSKIYLYLAAVWVLVGISNIANKSGNSTWKFDFFAVLLFLILYTAETLCANKGSTGKTIIRWVYGGVLVALAVFLTVGFVR